jgi:hypothetical protein
VWTRSTSYAPCLGAQSTMDLPVAWTNGHWSMAAHLLELGLQPLLGSEARRQVSGMERGGRRRRRNAHPSSRGGEVAEQWRQSGSCRGARWPSQLECSPFVPRLHTVEEHAGPKDTDHHCAQDKTDRKRHF